MIGHVDIPLCVARAGMLLLAQIELLFVTQVNYLCNNSYENSEE